MASLSSLQSFDTDDDEQREGVELLAVGVPFDYVVPHFHSICGKLPVG